MFSLDDQSIEIPEEDVSDSDTSVSNDETESLDVTDETKTSESKDDVVKEEPQVPQTTIKDEKLSDNPFIKSDEAPSSDPEPKLSEDMLAGIEERVEEAEAEVIADNPFIKADAKLKADAEKETPYADFDLGIDEDSDDTRAWYVVHCYSGYENKVRHNLEQRIETMNMKEFIFDVVVPTEEEIEVKDGKRKSVERRVFPGYILVNMKMNEESWYVVRNTPGVTSFVGMGNDPIPLRKEEVAKIMKRMEADAPRIKVTFRQGERVRIVDGPFNDFRGTVSEIDMDKAKVRVMVNFFGRETPVELDFLQVEKS
jgi:transcriptional antiterminator NusG